MAAIPTPGRALSADSAPSADSADPAPERRRPRRAGRARVLPMLILAASTLMAMRAVEFAQNGQVTALLRGETVLFGPGKTALAQDDSAPEPADGPAAQATPAPIESADTGAGASETPAGEGQPPVLTAQEALARLEADEGLLAPDGVMPSEMELLMSLRDRRATLDERASSLDRREALLQAAEMRIDEKVEALDATRREIEMLLGKLDEAEEARLTRLVQVYEIMKPAEAARILDGLERDVLLSVMERMNERKLAPILASMNPGLAREITADLSLRRRLPDLPEG